MVKQTVSRTEASASIRSGSLRAAIAWVCLGLLFAVGMSYYKRSSLKQYASDSLETVRGHHSSVLSLFQASFYFFYDDQFLPGIRQSLSNTPGLERIQILSSSGQLLFDSVEPESFNPSKSSAPAAQPGTYNHPEVITKLAGDQPSLFISGFQVQALMPAGQYGILYTFGGRPIRNRILLLLTSGLLLGLLVAFGAEFLSRCFPTRAIAGRRPIQSTLDSAIEPSQILGSRLWGLRGKFLLTIVLINLITGGIVFLSLTELQTHEESRRIRNESLLFSQFSTAQVISDFSNFFYFYYGDKFLPGVKTIIATNENLLGIRIISRRTGTILFDSETAATSGPSPASVNDSAKADFPVKTQQDLKTTDLVPWDTERAGEKLLAVVNTYRNENREALFYVQYLFSFETLNRSILGIRRQILLDLVPSLVISLLIATAFAQFLISPIRRLVAALQRVSTGDYEVSVENTRRDEVGELVTAFNSMTGELRKKAELRKYLSDSTYRQIMEAPDTPGGVRLGGTRVEATVLFSDIRNFVSHCENLEAEEVTAMLNEYFSEMVEVVYKHGGEVDKFIGDALLAVFYVQTSDSAQGPTSTSTSLQAIYCALEMRERLIDFNQKREGLGKNRIEIGVGITHGEIISGPIGSKDRMDFTVIGDVVNLANRIEKLSKLGVHTKIVFSQHVETQVRGLLEYQEIIHEPIRGKEENIAVYELIRIRDINTLVRSLSLPDVADRLRAIELLGQSRNKEAIPVIVAALEDANEQVRLRSVLALARLVDRGDSPVIESLLRRLDVEKSEKVISGLVMVIGKLCRDERIFKLSRFLDSIDERIVANTVEAMGQTGLPQVVDLILPKLGSRNNRVKANAAMALFAAGRIEVIDSLKPMLMYSDPLMRSSAAFAIGELSLLADRGKLLESWKTNNSGTKVFLAELQECVPMLVSLLRDPEPAVKRQSIIALGKIKDKSAVLPILDTIDLTNDSKELIRDVAQSLRAIGSHKLVREVLSQLT